MIQLVKPQYFFSIGTMSGTSMDGIDVALIKTDGYFLIEEISHFTLKYTNSFHFILKAAEYCVQQRKGNLEAIDDIPIEKMLKEYGEKDLNLNGEKLLFEVKEALQYLINEGHPNPTFQTIVDVSTQLHEKAIRELLKKIPNTIPKINLIGYHGQTLFHDPTRKITIQIGNPEQLAKSLNMMVIADFRVNDVLAGGQGAPFAPLYHQALMVRDNVYPGVVINCGGIANISVIRHLEPSTMMGFDTGPGNGLIDRFIKQKTKFKQLCDEDGQYGKQGQVNEAVLKALYQNAVLVQGENYFSLPIPKSLDIHDLQLIPELEALSILDACRTLEAFTADTIVESLKQLEPPRPSLLVLAGGGWYNPVIKQEFKTRVIEKLGIDIEVRTVAEMGWNNDALEAEIFAYLAVRSFLGEPISYPNITGVPRPLTGGRLVGTATAESSPNNEH